MAHIRRSSKKKFRGATIAFAAALLAAGCGHRAPAAAPKPAAAVVPTATAVQGAVFPSTSLPGIIAPLQNVAITSTLAEPADTVYVGEGDHVHRGQLLAQLDTSDLQAQLAADLATVNVNQAKQTQTYDQASLTIVQNQNTIDQARAMVRQAQQTLANDNANLQRYTQLVRSGYIPQQTYDAQATTVRNDRQAVRAAQVTLQNDSQQVDANGTTSTGLQGSQVQAAIATTQMTRAQADQIRVQISKAAIVSPIDGIVINRNINPGEYPGTRQLFTLQETDRVYAVLTGSAAAVAGVRTADTVKVASTIFPGKSFAGTVAGVLNPINPGSTNFIVKVLLANPQGVMRPGMPVSANAQVAPVHGVRIPATAFLDTTNSSIQTATGGVVHTVKVTMIAQDTHNAIVIGLAPGAVIVANGQLGLIDGQTVQPAAPQIAGK